MSQLDKLIERLQPQQEILLETGKEPMMRTETGTRIMVNQKLLTPQIISLLNEIATGTHRDNITARHQTNFEYLYNGKSYTVAFMVQGDQVRSVISITETKADEEDIAGENAAEDDQIEFIQEADPAEEAIPAARPAARAATPKTGEPEINALLRKMFGMGASDLHMTSMHKPVVRLHGDMLELSDQPVVTPDRMKKLLGAIAPAHNTAQFEELHDTDFAHEIEGLARFRVNFFKDRFGMGAVFRQIPMEIVTA